MIFSASKKDKDVLAQIKADEKALRHKKFSGGIVVKPWGYEYLWFEAFGAAIWVLWLGPGHNTSLHCHSNKATALVLISGEAQISGFDRSLNPDPGEVLYIEPGCFHRTTNVSSDTPLCIIEIETPIDKEDLMRFSDGYGRDHSKYESLTEWKDDSRGINNYHRMPFIDDSMIPTIENEPKTAFFSCDDRLEMKIGVLSSASRINPGFREVFFLKMATVIGRCRDISCAHKLPGLVPNWLTISCHQRRDEQ